MKDADGIIRYLTDTYRPDAVIVYGSFADGSADGNSDFDALVIAGREKTHDSSVIDGTVLDVFVCPADTFRSEYDPEEFVQVWDGKIVTDRDGTAERLQERVRDHLAHTPPKTDMEILEEIGWCEKMAARTVRDDAEGCYRWHWLLTDSLEIYCDAKGVRWFGPKKALRLMERTDEEAFRIYSEALKVFERDRLSEWIGYLKRIATALPLPRDPV